MEATAPPEPFLATREIDVSPAWNPLGNAILQAARLNSGRVALDDGSRKLTFAEVGEEIRGLVGALERFPPDSVVALISANRVEYVVSDMAATVGAFVRLGLNKRLHPNEVASGMARAGVTVLFCDAEWAARLASRIADASSLRLVVCFDEIDESSRTAFAGAGIEVANYPTLASSAVDPGFSARATTPDATATLIFTSGTTGTPKCVAHPRSAQIAIARGMASLSAARSDDVLIMPLPQSHAGGLFSQCYYLAGARQLIIDRASEQELLGLLAGGETTALASVPTVLEPLAKLALGAGLSFSRLRRVYYGGAPMRVDVVRDVLRAFGPVLTQLYGQSESGLPVTAMAPWEYAEALECGDEARLAAAGRPWGLAELALFDAGGEPIPQGEVGEICVRGDTVMTGYLGDEAATRAVFDAAGWLHTGDLGRFDRNGFLSVVGRQRDVIITGGFNVYPAEVESAISTLDSVRDVIVIGVSDPKWGESICAVIVPNGTRDVTREEVIGACEERLGRYKVPKSVRVAERLPVGATGKIDKRTLIGRLDELTSVL